MKLVGEQAEAFHTALGTLAEDMRFEWIDPKTLDEALWGLACEAKARSNERSLADEFVKEHASKPLTQTAFFPIVGLEIEHEIDLFGVKLMPATAIEMPDRVVALSNLVKIDSTGSVAAVEVIGTSDVRMATRGRETVEHALRVLRITLRTSEVRRPEPQIQARQHLVDREWRPPGGPCRTEPRWPFNSKTSSSRW
jgi:hypothetical protein